MGNETVLLTRLAIWHLGRVVTLPLALAASLVAIKEALRERRH